MLPALDVPLGAPDRREPANAITCWSADKPVNDPRTYRLQLRHCDYRCEPDAATPRYRSAGLMLPDGFNPRTLALAAQWRAALRQRRRQAIVRAALTLFHDGGFSYTLAPAPLGRDAMDDFLFSTREGFCEHYASAFTVLMRAAGIPARVVTGYQGGYWNKLGNYLLVRQSDAHAWSEVWIAGRGWVRVDPTGAVRPERVHLGAAQPPDRTSAAWYQNAWLQGLRNRWDIVNRWWDQGVIGFDALRQRGLLTPFGVQRTDTRMLALLLTLGSVLFIAASGLAWAMMRRRAHAIPRWPRCAGWNASWPGRRGAAAQRGPAALPAAARPARCQRSAPNLTQLMEQLPATALCRQSNRRLNRCANFVARSRDFRRRAWSNEVDAVAHAAAPAGETPMSVVRSAHPRLRRRPAGGLRHGAQAAGGHLHQHHHGQRPAGRRRRHAGALGWRNHQDRTRPAGNLLLPAVAPARLRRRVRESGSDGNQQGRFVACRAGFYDPEVFTRGRELTVTGTLHGIVSQKVGDYDYAYPRVEADVVYLWPTRPIVVDYPPGLLRPVLGPGLVPAGVGLYGWGWGYPLLGPAAGDRGAAPAAAAAQSMTPS